MSNHSKDLNRIEDLKGLKVVFMGTPDFAIPTLHALHAYTDVVAVITQSDKRSGRGKSKNFTPVKKAALELGLPIYQFDKLNCDEAKQLLTNIEIDFIIVVAYGQIVKKWVIDLPKYSILNVHASLLPKLRGAAPIQRAILQDFDRTGVTIMEIDEGLDTGDMLAKVSVELDDSMDFGALHDILKDLGIEVLLDCMREIKHNIAIPIAQPSDQATYAATINKEEARIDFSQLGRQVFNQIRGFSPMPGAFCFINSKRYKLMKAKFFDFDEYASLNLPEQLRQRSVQAMENGEILANRKDVLFVKLCDGMLQILEIQPENSKRMDISEFLRGYDVNGLRFESF